MKKVLCIILIAVSVILGVASYTVKNAWNDSDTTIVDSMDRWYKDLDSYNDFLTTSPMVSSSSFVPWDKISVLGEFVSLRANYASFTYHFNSSGCQCQVALTAWSRYWYDEKMPSITVPYSKQMESMRYCTNALATKELVTIIRNGIAYRYGRDGYLWAITWVQNNVEYYICGNDFELSNYPDDNSVIGRLLSSSDSDVKSAIAELEAQLPGSKIHQPISKDTLSTILLIASGLCLTAVIVLFVLGMRKSIQEKKSVEET